VQIDANKIPRPISSPGTSPRALTLISSVGNFKVPSQCNAITMRGHAFKISALLPSSHPILCEASVQRVPSGTVFVTGVTEKIPEDATRMNARESFECPSRVDQKVLA
jgi:hypothetical protein